MACTVGGIQGILRFRNTVYTIPFKSQNRCCDFDTGHNEGEHGKIDHDKNDRVIDRNRAASEVAVKHGLTITDLYTPMYGRSDYRVADPEDLYHFNEQGQRAQAVLVSAILKQFLSS